MEKRFKLPDPLEIMMEASLPSEIGIYSSVFYKNYFLVPTVCILVADGKASVCYS
jgi:hypothetical protein